MLRLLKSSRGFFYHTGKLSAYGQKNKCNRYIWKGILCAVVYFCCGIIAGWTNENSAVALIVIVGLYILVFKLKQYKLSMWNITGLIGSICGFCIMVTAPGTRLRLKTAGGTGKIVLWLRRVVFITCDEFNYLQLLIIIFCLLLAVYVWQHNCEVQKNDIKEMPIVGIYLFGFLTSVYSMIVSPEFPKRVWSSSVVLGIIALGNLYTKIKFSDKKVIFKYGG